MVDSVSETSIKTLWKGNKSHTSISGKCYIKALERETFITELGEGRKHLDLSGNGIKFAAFTIGVPSESVRPRESSAAK